MFSFQQNVKVFEFMIIDIILDKFIKIYDGFDRKFPWARNNPMKKIWVS